MQYDHTRTGWDGRRCQIEFWVGEPDESWREQASPPRVPTAVLTVDFDIGRLPSVDQAVAGGPLGVRIRLANPEIVQVSLAASDPMTSTTLSRFGWRRWLAVAHDVARFGVVEGSPAASRAIREELGLPLRPGRRGRPLAHSRRVLEREQALRQEGDRHPAQTIADEEGVALKTAQGWLRRAHQLRDEGKLR